MKNDLLGLSDLGTDLERVLDRSLEFRALWHSSNHPRPLKNHTVALLFDQPSTRTRLSLEIATKELGGHPVVVTPETSQMGRGEPPEDTGRVLGRMVSLVAYRAHTSARLEALSRACRVPVLNALTDEAHPLQVLADLTTVRTVKGRLTDLKIVWVGDASNVARSWIEAAGLLKLRLVLATPEGFAPKEREIAIARARGGDVSVTSAAKEAAKDADVLITDVWVSMGREAETMARKKALSPYRLTRELVGLAKSDVMVLHCLPAHRGEEIEAEVLDGPRSYVWDAVEARLHTTKAALEWAIENRKIARQGP